MSKDENNMSDPEVVLNVEWVYEYERIFRKVPIDILKRRLVELRNERKRIAKRCTSKKQIERAYADCDAKMAAISSVIRNEPGLRSTVYEG